jgi:ATP-dependent DNA ligase
MNITQILTEIASDPSTNAKKAIIAANVGNDLLKQAFFYAYNPRFNFWIKADSLATKTGKANVSAETFKVLDRLVAREVTGNAARDIVTAHLNTLTQADQQLVVNIMNHDLRCGASDTLASKVWPKLVPEYPVMLASKMDEKAVKHLTKFEPKANAFIVQTKMDGGRLLAKVDESGIVTYMSRNGSTLNLFGVFDTDLAKFKGQVLDGELIVKTSSGLPDRKTGNGFYTKAVRDTLSESEAKKFTYVVWDIVPEAEYLAGVGTESYTARLAKLMKARLSSKVEIVESETAQTIDECLVFYQIMRDRGEEGAVIKVAEAVWEDSRSKNMVKLKAINDIDAKCVGTEPGQGKYANMIGALLCEDSTGMLKFSVGTGLKDDDRKKDPSYYIGSIVECTYNEIITAKGRDTKSLFLPVYKQVRLDKKTANSLGELK